MMCTAAVCTPTGTSPHHLLGFHQEEESPNHYSPSSEEKWSSSGRRSSTKGLALWLASPMADVIYSATTTSNSPKFSLLHSPSSPPRQAKVDIVSKLPIELSLSILQLLSDQDLCNVCLVCKQWYLFSLDHPLLIRRKTFVRSQRILFKQSKENYTNARTNTPPGPSRTRSSASLSPLCPIGNICSPPPSAVVETPRQLEYHRDLRSPPGSADSSRFHSYMSSVVDSVERLSIKGGGDTRRCLFPGIDSTPGNTRRKENTASSLPRQRRQPPYRLGKSKERLRRL